MTNNTYINAYNCISPLGMDVAENWAALLDNKTGIEKHHFGTHLQNIHAAQISNTLLLDAATNAACPSDFSRLEQMLYLALLPLITKCSVSDNSLLLLATTKGNISALEGQLYIPEAAYLQYSVQKLAAYFGFSAKPVVVSNACVSGVMAINIAQTMIQSGKYKDAFVIAADEVSSFIVSGFQAFQAISQSLCKPYDKNRDGINLGEAAAAAYISKDCKTGGCFEICGTAAVNDANHISGPSRTGEGLFRSVRNALKEAQLPATAIDLISAHGTATLYNDDMEAFAFNRLGMQAIPLHSLKGYYGHCLGTSGLLEAIIAMESAKHSTLIPSRNFSEKGTPESLNIIQQIENKAIKYILKTGSGFGGSNAALILKKI